MARVNFLTALRDAMAEEMRRDARVFVMGEDLRKNLYGSSAGLLDEFGAERVLDVPLAEAGVVGTAIGAAMVGMRPVVDITIAPFLYPACDQIISIAAKSRYLYGGQTAVPLVIRACMFYSASSAAQHSDRPYAMFMGIPGLKIVVPSGVAEAKGLLKAAIRDDDPVLFFEDFNLWGVSARLPDDEDLVLPLGRAAIKREGTDLTVFAVGAAVSHALTAAKQLEGEGISIEVIDPRTVKPLDVETVLASVRKTGRFLAVDPAHRTGSLASEIVATVSERAFSALKSAPVRLCTPDTHIPFAPVLEKTLYPTVDSIARAARRLVAGEVIHQKAVHAS
ncbi:MAG: transketolase C-terminal domain-containing protein [Steroidobacteraceae bacterium]